MDELVLAELLQPIEKLYNFTSSSSSSDDEERSHHFRVKNYVETIVRHYSNRDFKCHFRMHRTTVHILIELYATNYIARNRGWPQVGPEKAVLLSVWYLANLETFRQVADRFNVTLSCAYNTIKSVTECLVQVSDVHIRWPDAGKCEIDSQHFRNKKNLENIIGAIDGTHFRLNKPQHHQEDYCNRKGYHSIILQGVVNSAMEFIDVHVGEPGSMHDARVLRRSSLYRHGQEDPNTIFYGKYRLLGDSAYPSLPWLLTPVKDNGHLSNDDKNYNYRHSSTRIVIENAFGHLKGRFRRLQKFDNKKISFIVNCIGASCVLHNICQREHDLNDEIFVDYEENIN